MYDIAFTHDRIAAAEAEFEAPIVPHTVAEIDDWTARLEDVYDDTGQQLRKITKEEHAFITNERRMCSLDFRYWGPNYAKIRDLEGNVRRWTPNVAQNMILDIWGDFERQGHAIELLQIKARQLGVSTETELAVEHRAQFIPDINAIVASASPEQSEKMAKMMSLAYDEQPWWLVPRKTRDKAGELVEFGGQNSAISIQAGNQVAGLARGSTPDTVHLSELCDFPDPEELIDASLLRAVHPTPNTFMVFESTAKGRRNWLHRTWLYAVEHWASGKARFRPIFLPWFIGTDVWPTKTWIHQHPVPADWQPMPLTALHAERAAKYVASNVLLRKYLGPEWRMPMTQQYFYELDREEHRNKKELNKFLSEMPADDQEAFQSTNISAFDTDTITIFRESTKEPIGVYGIRGDQNEIPLRMHPFDHEVDHDKKPIAVRAAWGTNVSDYQLVPLFWHGWTECDPNGKIFLFQPPEDDREYGMGVDTGDGVGEDLSAIEIFLKGTHDYNDAQVIEYATPYVNAYNLWPIAYCLATLFSTYIAGERKQSKAVIECRGNGEAVQLEMRKRGWTKFHQWMRYDGKRLRLKDANKIGWFTNQWSRAAAMDKIMSGLLDGWVEIASPFFVGEMSDLERDEFHQSLKAMHGAHDDRFMAAAMVLFSMHVLDMRGGQRSARKELYSDDDYPTYSEGYQGNVALGGDMETYMKHFGKALATELKDRW